MEPNFSYSELKIMFYEWFMKSFPEKFSEHTPFEKEAICESNFKRLIEWHERKDNIAERNYFPEEKREHKMEA